MSKRPLINGGDLLRASAALGATPRERRKIAELLGFEMTEAEPPVPQPPPPVAPRPAPPTSIPEAHDAGGPAPVASEPERPATEPGGVNEAWVQTLEPRPLYAPPWFGEVESLPEWAADETREPRPDPLFKPEWVRALLSLLLSVGDRHGAFDWERAVELLSSGESPSSLPRLPRLRMADAVQVLVDLNDSMRPFAQDQYELLSDIRRLMPARAVTELYFKVSPARGVGRSGGWPRDAYEPPPPLTPVLLITDLGAAPREYEIERPRRGEWLGFAELARRAGCPVVAVVPYEPARVSAALRRAMCVVGWDRATAAGQVRRLRDDYEKRAP